ncbi:hypothetical protein [Loktanella sp. SALINAS62]|uniref:hypothetical protein n=1 Tax=Loktanella sp. SALINAS62 TaxID=2706124 RepID=UPI001B8DA501|nr:hypothetical protein [Loktanella sp. SALINAS62]MBS1303046.1 hypothetical protein [Loktanella sp. SALINAS62]
MAGNKSRKDNPAKTKLSNSDVVFLHIGKTAGSHITRLSRQVKDLSGVSISTAPHQVRLMDIPNDKPYFFSIRNPISRFKSGFYSRKRRGSQLAPEGWNPVKGPGWTPSEKILFSEFEHANDLAENLYSDGIRGVRAMYAITSSDHIGRHQIDWFFKRGYFLDENPPIWIIRQEHFDTDYTTFIRKAKLQVEYESLKENLVAERIHASDYSDSPDFSDLAIKNLSRWYSRDFIFYDICVAWMQKNI